MWFQLAKFRVTTVSEVRIVLRDRRPRCKVMVFSASSARRRLQRQRERDQRASKRVEQSVDVQQTLDLRAA